jgi:hypothetical protein
MLKKLLNQIITIEIIIITIIMVQIIITFNSQRKETIEIMVNLFKLQYSIKFITNINLD